MPPRHSSAESGDAAYWITVLATSAAFFIIVLDTSIINLALSTIAQAFHDRVAALQWLVDGYAMTFASLLLGAGVVGDRFGVRSVFVTGLVVFSAASLLCGLAPNMAFLQLARVLQGVGAALLLPNSLAVLNHALAHSPHRSKAVGIWASAGALGIALGPVSGGVLLETLGWRSIFLVNLPVGVMALWLTLRHLPRSTPNPGKALDWTGQVLAIAALATLTYLLISAKALLAAPAELLLSGAACVALVLGFLWVESRTDKPMLPLKLLSIPTLGPVALVGMLHNFAVYGLIFVLSLDYQRLQGLGALRAGLLFLPMTVSLAIGTRVGARLLRGQPFRPLFWGHLLAGGGVALLAAASGTDTLAPLITALGGIGLGAGVTTPAMSLAILDSVALHQSGLASGVLNSARQIGGVLGVAVLGTVMGDPVSRQGVLTAEHISTVMFILAAGLASLATSKRKRSE